MERVINIYHDGQLVRLVDEAKVSPRDNTYTVVVGENGVGKSRLLSDIARLRISEYYGPIGTGQFSHPPHPVVVAASTSPFDKFPAPPRRSAKAQKNYRYVGMRGEGMYGSSSAVSLLSSAARGLLSKLAETPPSLNLLGVLESAGTDEIDHLDQQKMITRPSLVTSIVARSEPSFPQVADNFDQINDP